MIRRLLLQIAAMLLVFGASNIATAEQPLTITATTGMVADVVQQVVGTHGAVTTLIQSGVDPHLYKPTRSDIVKLTSSDIVFYNGLLLEGKMTDALVRLATSGKKVYAVTEQIDESLLLEPEGFAGHYDPHVWMDPLLWKETVAVVEKVLSEFRPANSEAFKKNAAAYMQSLDVLHAYAVSTVATIPKASRVLVTAHDAFNYFGARYGLEVVGIQGLSTESEAGVQDIERIVALLVDRSITSVFIESTVSDKNIRALIEGAKARNHTVQIGGALFSDAMGKPSTYEGTYIGMIDHNVTNIVRALGGTAPARGMQDKLQ